MLYLAVDSDGTEYLFIGDCPTRYHFSWVYPFSDPNYPNYRTKDPIVLPEGSIERLIGIKLTWEDYPIVLDPSIPLKSFVRINQGVLDYINSGNGHFDYIPKFNSIWKVDRVKSYPGINNGELVLELYDEEDNWLRLPKVLFD